MQCPECGETIGTGARFCQHCGAELAAGGPAAEAREGLLGAVGMAGRAAPEVEQQIWQGGYSPRAMIGHWVSVGVASAATLIAAAAWGASARQLTAVMLLALGCCLAVGLLQLYRQWSVQYRLTNHRFVHRSGLLRRVTDRVEVIDIDDVGFQQGLFERLFGVGSVELSSSDRTHPYLRLKGIADVERVAGLIDDARREQRHKRGLHIETI